MLADPVNFVDPSGLVFQRVIEGKTTPHEQAALGALGLVGGFTFAVAGIKSLSAMMFVGGLVVAFEGGANLTHAVKNRGAKSPLEDLNLLKSIGNFQVSNESLVQPLRCER